MSTHRNTQPRKIFRVGTVRLTKAQHIYVNIRPNPLRCTVKPRGYLSDVPTALKPETTIEIRLYGKQTQEFATT